MKSMILAAIALLALSSLAHAQELPRFDVEAHCNTIASFGGNFSNMTYNGCIDIEQASYNGLKGRWSEVPAAVRRECIDIATFGGTGDYATLQGCIDMEMSAASNQSTFSFD